VRFTFRAIDVAAWACPWCDRVMPIFADRTWVICGGGWLDEHTPLHPFTDCLRVPDSVLDPLELYRYMSPREDVAA
jgi:hypothetical protein